MQGAVIGGFQQAEQTELLEPWVEPYFASLREIWATRTGEMAQNLVAGLYPTLLVSQAVVDRTTAFLADTADGPVPPAMARLLAEASDGVQRALRARERDAASA